MNTNNEVATAQHTSPKRLAGFASDRSSFVIATFLAETTSFKLPRIPSLLQNKQLDFAEFAGVAFRLQRDRAAAEHGSAVGFDQFLADLS